MRCPKTVSERVRHRHPPTTADLPGCLLACLLTCRQNIADVLIAPASASPIPPPLPPSCSSNVAWQYGVSGPFWYASGATIQILLFGILAVEIKRKAPKAHTMLEIVRARWGNTAHKVGGGPAACCSI